MYSDFSDISNFVCGCVCVCVGGCVLCVFFCFFFFFCVCVCVCVCVCEAKRYDALEGVGDDTLLELGIESE